MSCCLQHAFRLWLALLCLLLLSAVAHAQFSKRLILKDGSYQAASKWEVQGDRVRYFSSERNEWEEIPSSMVDWPATENYEKQRQAQRTLDLQKPDEEEPAEKAGDAFTVAPGLTLPNSGGAFLLDTYNKELQLAELSQSGGELSRQRGQGILRGALSPVASSRQSIAIEGEHARIQSHVLQPSIFLAVEDEPGTKPLPPAERFRIVRLETRKGSRVVSNLKVAAVTGKVSQHENYLPAMVEQLPGGWVKLTPQQPLSPGEYAIVERLDSKTLNLYVWDFGVNPASPANADVWRAVPAPSSSGESLPDLQNRQP